MVLLGGGELGSHCAVAEPQGAEQHQSPDPNEE